jgi:hypothetical protein
MCPGFCIYFIVS